ncbi:MAG: glutamine--tRNA ligase/YqeY domain fusion protein [Chitinophagaceae bacterium]|nr:glutamine--tRNA ligase/YqeY domain fusion protein [Chitinophagaceae bacterium]
MSSENYKEKTTTQGERSLNFLEELIENDLKAGKYTSIVTRFPPEPNGYLHLGHASSICLNFGLTEKYPGYTNLRFDDTNPTTEETEYVESIKADIQWLGFSWKHERYASDYFEQLYNFAIQLIEADLAYVDDSTAEEIATLKGTPTEAGKNSPYRSRSIEENKDLFLRMKNGEFPDGSRTVRAKIDMAHTNMLMRDPVLYRIKHAHHHRTADAWCIYPMYDFAHGQSDSIEKVTHSLCTMEFVPHRELYDWLIQKLNIYPSHQYEFARRNINYTVTSKRKLLQLVNEKFVSGWDDPRMPTISGLRRRGFTPKSIRVFCEKIGIGKRDNMVDLGLLEFCLREDLNKTALRRMVVFDPVKLVITNYDKAVEMLQSENNPEDENSGTRDIPFSHELLIERNDFMEEPPKKYFRLAPGKMVRLKSAYIIQCDEVIKDEQGNITELHCSYIPESKSGADTSGIKVKGTIHWVNAKDAVPIEVREYDRLFKVENPAAESGDFTSFINPDSLKIVEGMAEPSINQASGKEHFQFIRKGYYCLDKDATKEKLIFNRSVTLKDSWAKK